MLHWPVRKSNLSEGIRGRTKIDAINLNEFYGLLPASHPDESIAACWNKIYEYFEPGRRKPPAPTHKE